MNAPALLRTNIRFDSWERVRRSLNEKHNKPTVCVLLALLLRVGWLTEFEPDQTVVARVVEPCAARRRPCDAKRRVRSPFRIFNPQFIPGICYGWLYRSSSAHVNFYSFFSWDRSPARAKSE